MKKYIEYPVLFIIGAVVYCLLEIIWRGFTHWTMGIAGGACLVLIYYIRKCCPDVPLYVRCITGAAIICAIEFAVGFAVNIVLEWNVWDYSDRWLNIEGQICPLYAFLWFLLCIPGNMLCRKLEILLNRKASRHLESTKG